jgi:hypothetical protein
MKRSKAPPYRTPYERAIDLYKQGDSSVLLAMIRGAPAGYGRLTDKEKDRLLVDLLEPRIWPKRPAWRPGRFNAVDSALIEAIYWHPQLQRRYGRKKQILYALADHFKVKPSVIASEAQRIRRGRPKK